MSDVDKYAWKLGAVILVLTIIFLQGCGTINTLQSLNDDPSLQLADAISKTTKADLDMAMADAVAHNDIIAQACYPVLGKYLNMLNPGQEKPLGIFSAFQKSRDLATNVNGGIPDDLRLACAALVQSTRDFALKMSVIAAGASHGIPIP